MGARCQGWDWKKHSNSNSEVSANLTGKYALSWEALIDTVTTEPVVLVLNRVHCPVRTRLRTTTWASQRICLKFIIGTVGVEGLV